MPQLHPETCAHCASIIKLTQLAKRGVPPEEVISRALLLGFVVGQDGDPEISYCDECSKRIVATRNMLFGPPPAPPGREALAPEHREAPALTK